MNSNRDTTGDPLTGKPELFATNLLLKRALDEQIKSITFQQTNSRVEVQLESQDQSHKPEVLSDNPDTWDRLDERIRDLVDESGEFQPGFPTPESVQSIDLSRHSSDEIRLDISYQNPG